jgi:hypothetical protein
VGRPGSGRKRGTRCRLTTGRPNDPDITKTPPSVLGGVEVLHGVDTRQGSCDEVVDGARCPLPLVAAGPVAHPRRPALGGHAGGDVITRARERDRGTTHIPRGGAAGSRTRVPRPRSSGLYVRRSRMISDHGAPRPDSSVVLAALKFPPQPGGMGIGVEPRYVDPTLLRGVRGGSLAVFMPRESTGRFRQLWFPTHFVEVTSASSARSPGSGMATVEAVSAPGLGRAHRRSAVLKDRRFVVPAPNRE